MGLSCGLHAEQEYVSEKTEEEKRIQLPQILQALPGIHAFIKIYMKIVISDICIKKKKVGSVFLILSVMTSRFLTLIS